MINNMDNDIKELKEKGVTSWLIKTDNNIEKIKFDFQHLMDQCWTLTKETGCIVRNIGLDGKASWGVFKNELEQINRPSMLTSSIQAMLPKHYKVEDNDLDHNNCIFTIGTLTMKHFDKNDEMKEQHHFLIQHFRLIAMCTDNIIPFNRLMQLAYNAGQFEADRKKYDPQIVAFYDANKLGDIETYVK